MKKITLLFFLLIATTGFAQSTHTVNFEPAGVGSGWDWTMDQNVDNPALEFISNPVSSGINTTSTVAKFTARAAGQPWALCFTSSDGTFTFDGTNSTVKIMVYKTVISDVGIKFEGSSPAIEIKVANTVINQWEELTFDFSGQMGNSYNKLVLIPDFAARAGENIIYFDNIQLPDGVESSSGPTTAAPTPVARNASDLISIFSDAYTDVVGTDFDPFWGQTTDATIIDISGNSTLKYENLNYQGTAFTTQNVSSMEYFHIDYYTSDATVLQFFLIDGGAEQNYDFVNQGGITTGSWVSVDIPMTYFSGLSQNLANIYQFKVVGNGTVYFDNFYFWKAPPVAGSDATLSDLQVDGVTIDAFGSSTMDYTYELVVGTTVVPQITSVTTTDLSATSAVITQATAIPGDATVLVTSQNGSVTETYTVSFATTIPNPSPTPSTPNAEVLSIYGDTGGFTTNWSSDYTFGSFVDKLDLDQTAGVNEAIKMDFSIAGYGAGTNTQSDISSYNWVHFDYFVSDLSPGVNGHLVKFILIGGGEFNYEMTLGGSDGTLVLGSWQSVDVPLSVFEGKGFSKTNFLQFKLGTTSDLNTSIVYFDNIYFSVNQGTLGTKKFEIEGLTAYPNPTTNMWTITTGNEDITSIEIYNVLGKSVIYLKPNARIVQIDASQLATGIYISKITTATGTSTRKLIRK